MPRAEFFTLEAPASMTAGAARDVEDFSSMTVQISGTFVATLAVEGSVDGVTFAAIGSTSTPSLIQVPGTYKKLRINTTAFTSGVPVAKLGVRNDRTR